MNPVPSSDFVEFALRMAQDAGKAILPHFRVTYIEIPWAPPYAHDTISLSIRFTIIAIVTIVTIIINYHTITIAFSLI